MSGKPWYTSKMLWVNVVGISAMVAQRWTGFLVPVEDQAIVLGLINLILRLITKQPLGWSNETQAPPPLPPLAPPQAPGQRVEAP